MRTVRHLILPALLLTCTLQVSAQQQQQTFPYPATVAVDDVDVRCGPGQRYYVTSKLQAGTRITVHRHDHGGWFMIAPPPGSFSWIAAEHVDVQGDRGTVRLEPTPEGLPARAIVRIGSELSDDHAFYGRELSDGDTVRILSRKMLQTERGAREMLQIQPPAQEFRWIKGDYVVPVDATVRQQQANDPFQIPPQHRPRMSSDLIVAAEPSPKAKKTSELEARLARADQRYEEMMSRSPQEWNLDAMHQEYADMLADADPITEEKIEQRLRVLDSRRSVHEQYQRFQQITSQASMRDAQLASMQSRGNVAYGHWTADASGPTLADAHPQTAAAGPVPELDDVQPRLNGAGIVKPIGIVGMPPYALVAPDGRFLAYLEPTDDRQLHDWIGKEAGIIGQRQFAPQYNADLIRVRRITAVQLVK
ncbi:MAG: hypothetical protein KDA90_16405 [Planctomycetaceae bacterium]|nr:hypothetical protein [Planctomycetaceae bacterium]